MSKKNKTKKKIRRRRTLRQGSNNRLSKNLIREALEDKNGGSTLSALGGKVKSIGATVAGVPLGIMNLPNQTAISLSTSRINRRRFLHVKNV